MIAMLKALINLLQNHNALCLKTTYVAFVTLVLQSLYERGLEVDLDLFYGKVNFGSFRLSNGLVQLGPSGLYQKK